MKARLAGGIVLLVLSAFCLPAPTPVLAECRHCFTRCTDTCVLIRRACADRCVTGCAALYPGDPAASAACRETCRPRCVSLSEDCRALCRVTMVPVPMEP